MGTPDGSDAGLLSVRTVRFPCFCGVGDDGVTKSICSNHSDSKGNGSNKES